MDSVAALVQETKAAQLPSPAVCREIRERAGLTLSDIARALDVTPTSVHRWEAGYRPRRAKAIEYRRLLEELREVTA